MTDLLELINGNHIKFKSISTTPLERDAGKYLVRATVKGNEDLELVFYGHKINSGKWAWYYNKAFVNNLEVEHPLKGAALRCNLRSELQKFKIS